MNQVTLRRRVSFQLNQPAEVRAAAALPPSRKLIVYRTDDPQTVRGLAQHLSVSKIVITNAFDRLTELGVVRRRVDPADRRSVFAVRTEAGQAMVARLKASLAAGADGPG